MIPEADEPMTRLDTAPELAPREPAPPPPPGEPPIADGPSIGEAPPPPPDRTTVLVAITLAVALFSGSWWALHALLQAGFFGNVVITDIPVYLRFATDIAGGQLPYRDFSLVYPPGSIPAFVIPALATLDKDAYAANFEALMLAFGVLAIVFATIALWRLGASRLQMTLALGFIGVSPVLIGPVILSHYDLWPAAITTAALAAVASGRLRIAAVVLALAIVAKIYPVVLLPLLLDLAWRRSGRREAVVCAALVTIVSLLVVAPFLAVAPGGVLQPVVDQVLRPLQIESLGAAILFVLHSVAGTEVTIVSSFGSQNLGGQLPQLLAAVQSLTLIVALAAVWTWFHRGQPDERRFVLASAAALAAFVAFGKVLSPQYLIWLIPVVPLVQGRRGVLAMAVLAVALILTGAYFPKHYFDLVKSLSASAAWTILLRDLALVVLFGALTLFGPGMRRGVRSAYAAFDRRVPVAGFVPSPGTALILILVAAFLLRALWLTQPSGSLIFDETYYVNAARVMMGIHPPPDAPYAAAPLFLDPNTEHPPLGKALIGGSILLFGDNGLGWRVPSLIAGIVALAALYGIVRALGGRPWTAVLATAIYSLDVLSFIHGRIATLDMLSLGFIMLGAWLGLRGRWGLAGAALAAGTLVKVPGIYGFGAVFLWQVLSLWGLYRRQRRLGWRDLLPPATLVVSYVVVGLGGLALLDLRFTAFTNPIDHVRRILGYGFALQPTYSPNSITSGPWDWLTNGGQFDYLKVAVNTLVNGEITGSRTTIEFRALMNPVLVGSALIAVLYGAWLWVKRGEPVARWSLIWMAANFLPFVVLALLANRVMYFYYVLPTVPALAAITALFLVRSAMPRWVVGGYVVASVVAFIAYFPFRQVP